MKKLLVSRSNVLLQIIFASFSLLMFFYFVNSLHTYQPYLLKTKRQVLSNKIHSDIKVFPMRLIIPAIHIDAKIQNVGITPEGVMEVPKNIAYVGWFDLGPRPGELGSAVIAGHLNGKNGESGIFANLSKLQKGDKLYIAESDGTLISFLVKERLSYDPGYAENVFSKNDTAHLNLITCEGIWDNVKKSYSKRLVIFSDIVRNAN